jgi:hypothetical protein
MSTPVVVEYNHITEDRFNPPKWQLIVSERSEPDRIGNVYKQVVEVRECASLHTHKRYVSRHYKGRVVKQLDLRPLIPSLF